MRPRRPWWSLGGIAAPSGPGDTWSDVELVPACCPACGGSGVDDERMIDDGMGGSYSVAPCEACEGTGYASAGDAEIDALYACDADDDVGPVEAHCG